MDEKKPTKPRQYWGNKEEIQCFKFYSAINDGNTYEEHIYFKKLENKLRWMIESIMLRYFQGNYNYHDTDTIVNDVLTFVVIKFHNFDTAKNKTFYSYLSGIIKNNIYHRVVSGYEAAVDVFHLAKDRGLYVELNDDILDIINNHEAIETNDDMPVIEILTKRIIKLIENKEKNLHLYQGDAKSEKHKEITILKLIHETILRFEGNLSIVELTEIIKRDLNISPYYINKCFDGERTIFFSGKNTRENKKKYVDEMIDFDFCPNEKNIHYIIQKKKKIKNENLQIWGVKPTKNH